MNSPFLSAAQCRAARAYLNWSVDRLSDLSEVSASTISLFEREAKDPSIASLRALRGAFEKVGVTFASGSIECVCCPAHALLE